MNWQVLQRRLEHWLLAALLAVAGVVQAQSQLPGCPRFGVKYDCFGVVTTPSGQRYSGEFRDGKRTGQGTLTIPGGLQYVGEFKDGYYHGLGTLTMNMNLPGGWVYVGEFKLDKFDGQGTLTQTDGRKYVGAFKDDKFNGEGTLTLPDGRKYVGEFTDDTYYGQGIEYRADGSILRSGVWERNTFLRSESVQLSAVRPAQPAPDQAQEVTRQRTETPAITKLAARALVIGNGAYTNFGRLPNPRSDAQAIAAKFRSFGIEVDLVLDADRDTLVRALNEYASKATGKDVNILFYAGHGLQIEGTNYLIPTNMRADGISAGYVKLNGISLNAVMDYMPASTRLIFLDACRDNPASRSLVATRGAGSVGLAPVSASTGTLIAYATKEGTVAADGDGKNSPYTTALLRHLDAPLDIGIVLRRVRQTVLQMTSNTQEPWEYGSLIGDQLILSQMAR